jgi:DNA helicase IV
MKLLLPMISNIMGLKVLSLIKFEIDYKNFVMVFQLLILGAKQMNLFKTIKEFFLRLSLSKFIPQIRNELQNIEGDISEIKLLKNEVSNSILLIPEDYIPKVKTKQKAVTDYVESNSVYSFNRELEHAVSIIKKRPVKFFRLETEYQWLRETYNNQLDQLEKEIIKVNNYLAPYFEGIKEFYRAIEILRKQYIAHSDLLELKGKFYFAFSFFESTKTDNHDIQQFVSEYTRIVESIKLWNEEFVSKEMTEMEQFLSDVDGKSLDDQQRRAVIVDEDANLVVAGAGAGKTLTISGKVKYLVEEKGLSPEQILLVSFTRKAADEMEERIKKRLNIDVDVKTFHKLGINIIAKQSKRKPDVVENPQEIIKSYFNNEMYDDPTQLKRMIEFFGYYLNIPKDLEEFKTLGECYDHQKSLDLETLKSKYEEQTYINNNSEELKRKTTTLQGEKVKSLEEVMIANFLFLNGISYVYEGEYKYSSANEYYRRYKPDFYLPEYEIYIEHFGITKDERTPWLSAIEEQRYIEGMKWKREVHIENNTTLIETYSYLTKEGKLLEFLRKKLLSQQVKFKEVDFIDVFNKIYDTANTNHFDEFIKFSSSFINLFKSNGFGFEKFDELLSSIDTKNIFFFNRTRIFLEIIKPVYEFYSKNLRENNLIDFNDMINNAAAIVREGELDFQYKYIIIDEYQDISVSRFLLINEIRDKTKAKVMCVGDDWQSIYRFAGSDLTLFTEFERFFGYSQLLKIEKTYRNSQQLINMAGQFIMKNPKQLKKNLTSDKVNAEPIQILTYTGKNEIFNTIKAAIEDIVAKFGKQAEIMLLGRNNFDINFITEDPSFMIKRTKKDTKLVYNKYPRLKLSFLTSHRSKGLEADNVIIINAANSLLGFPNRISDDPILSLVLTDQDEFLYAEERRLFYVAITRTKNVTYILAPDKIMSVFVKELTEENGIELKVIEGNTTISNNPKCPRCIEGHLEIRENGTNKQKFLGCSNYPLCDYTLKDIKVIDNKVCCSKCKGYMVIRKGSRGEFYGCSNYPYCKHTAEIGIKKSVAFTNG